MEMSLDNNTDETKPKFIGCRAKPEMVARVMGLADRYYERNVSEALKAIVANFFQCTDMLAPHADHAHFTPPEILKAVVFNYTDELGFFMQKITGKHGINPALGLEAGRLGASSETDTAEQGDGAKAQAPAATDRDQGDQGGRPAVGRVQGHPFNRISFFDRHPANGLGRRIYAAHKERAARKKDGKNI